LYGENVNVNIGSWHIVEYRRRTGVITGVIVPYHQFRRQFRDILRIGSEFSMDQGRILAERCSELERKLMV